MTSVLLDRPAADRPPGPLAPPRRAHECVAHIDALGDLIERLRDAQDQEWTAARAVRIDEVERTVSRLAACDLTRGWCRVSGPVVTARHCVTCVCGDAA